MFWILFSYAFAARVSMNEVKCPIGDDYARVFHMVSNNQLGGYDSDLATYSSGQQFRAHAISTCYENYFSLYGKDFETPIPTEKQDKIKQILAEQKSKLLDPKEPTIWERYSIAAAIYRELGRSHLFLAQLYIEASWTIRDTIVGYHRGLEGPKSVSYILEQAPKELIKSLTDEQRSLLLFNLARVAHRGGYHQLRDHYLSMFATHIRPDSNEQKSLQYFQTVVIPLEIEYQQKAMVELEAALLNKTAMNKADLQRTYYWIADLKRRLGKFEEAKPYYQKAQAEGDNSQIIELSGYFLKE
ncbi:MAG: tetratricopeptide repeat protein [Myxococcota bacterium]|nr:tetratricopeptide repeat protein [Myxococcota bacterium]